MFGGCCESTDSQLIKRRLKNFAQELKGLGSKQLTSREQRRLRERYQEIIHIIERKKGKIPPREYKKLWVKVDEFRQNFQHFGFFEMEPPTNREFDVRDNQVEENKNNLRSATAGKGGEEHTEISDSSNPSDEYFAVKAQLENVITFSKDVDSLDIDNWLKQQKELFADITQNRKLSYKERRELLILCKRYKTDLENTKRKTKDEDLMEHYDATGTQNYKAFSTNYSVQNSGCWNKPSSDSKSSTSDPSYFNRYNKEINQVSQNPNFPKSDELARVHTSSHKTNFGFNPSTKGASFEKDQTKYEEEMDHEMVPEQTTQTRSAKLPTAYTRTVELVSGMPRPTINNSCEEQHPVEETGKNTRIHRDPETEIQDTKRGRREESAAERIRHSPRHNEGENCARKQNGNQKHHFPSYNDPHLIGKKEGKMYQDDSLRTEEFEPHFHNNISGTKNFNRPDGSLRSCGDNVYSNSSTEYTRNNSNHQYSSSNLSDNPQSRHRGVLEIAQEAKEDEPLQILDVHKYFRDDIDWNKIDSFDFPERIEAISSHAGTFKPQIESFDEEKYSLEYFVIDEKLMRLIEKLDKIKCQDNPALTHKKIEVIEYIKNLQSLLDQRAKE
ncbi:hypothetical protein Zmor_022864 [Zophobas morio]|uniref:BAG domain-containing protein n=1 Tax=Zophobas morio TaxID=2755281 RepID=A0AA38HXJ4_9CUCU|nr:hypothetical protein Zmor_022864 [Zophobas morio]